MYIHIYIYIHKYICHTRTWHQMQINGWGACDKATSSQNDASVKIKYKAEST